VTLSNSARSPSGVRYSIGFTVSTTGALTGDGDSITVAAPTGASFASSSVAVYDENQDARRVQQCCNTMSNGNATLKIRPPTRRGHLHRLLRRPCFACDALTAVCAGGRSTVLDAATRAGGLGASGLAAGRLSSYLQSR
jgi:hypothetical protein